MQIRIRPTIFTIFLSLFFLSILITLTMQYYQSKELARDAIYNTTQHLSQKIEKRIEVFHQKNKEILSFFETSNYIDIEKDFEKDSILLSKITSLINMNKYIYAIYIGYENENFTEIINLSVDPILAKKHKAEKDESWIIVKTKSINGKKIHRQIFINKNFVISREVVKETNYNPKDRVWHKNALDNQDEVSISSPYKFKGYDSFGITYSKKINNTKNVIALDVALTGFDNFLKEERDEYNANFYIHDDKGFIIGSNKHKNRLDYKKLSNFGKNNKSDDFLQVQEVTIEKKDYFYINSPIKTSHLKQYLSILIPQNIIMKPYQDKIYSAISANLIFVLCILPLIWFAAEFIVKPIKKIEKQNINIKNREYEKIEEIKTPIKELSDLSKSLVLMSNSIQEYEQSQIELMDSFIKLIAAAIDAKSEYTGAHCNRVPILTKLIINKANKEDKGIFKEFNLKSKDELREIDIAAWLHDCGKVTTPEYVVDKATKLETIYNRIHEIRTRFEVVYRDLIITAYKRKETQENKRDIEEWLEKEQKKLIYEYELVAKANIGAEFMNDEDKKEIEKIAQREWKAVFDGSLGLSQEERLRYIKNESKTEYLLANKESHIIERTTAFENLYPDFNFKINVPEHLYNLGEVYNLTINKGTLTKEERFKINEHIMMTIKMLNQLPFPKNLEKVPEYAGAHHETLIGTGYPRKLTKEQMSIPARIMAVADVFEALTASDRPYKEAKTLSQSIKILSFMVKDKHLDEDIFKLFLTSGAYLEYAKEYLTNSQIDDVDITSYIKG